ncbi:MAG: cob(I)yrinic acid a,c-diamide adenosyltransferase [Bacteroidia bacterium]|nr:cob(I)yrinic acid a,c-diamide adenosyltransferase [Bacteroidia bacterium]|tara:strand:+ start:2074 stop:2604 length:531 start_codon:yes stop_codon:yes gene_type:complete
MKIYTKTGDKGETSLLGGTRVSKAHHKLEAYGTVDELNSTIGLIAAMNPVHQNFLLNIQHKLFNIGSELAAEKNLSFPLPELTEEEINVLEKEIDRLNEKLPKLKNFILPGGSVISAHTQIARCVCRRAERNVVGLNESKYTTIIGYLNRLSDYLFVLSRDFLRLEGVEEIKWEKE